MAAPLHRHEYTQPMALSLQHAHRGLSRPARAAYDVAGYAVGGLLGAAAALRRAKAVHPKGAVHRAELVTSGDPGPAAGGALFAEAREHTAVVRFSRSLGLPRPLPDLLGMAVRVLDAYGRGAHQDFLMVTSVDAPVLHHLFVPASDVQLRPYSTSLPYTAGGKRFIVGALPVPGSPRPDGSDELDRLDRAAATGRLSFDLAVAPVMGRFQPVAQLRVGARLADRADALRFDPFNTGGGLELAGALNRLRDYAYPMSQRAWAATGPDGAQEAAEREVSRVTAPERGAAPG